MSNYYTSKAARIKAFVLWLSVKIGTLCERLATVYMNYADDAPMRGAD
jgi:hypothetical protein